MGGKRRQSIPGFGGFSSKWNHVWEIVWYFHELTYINTQYEHTFTDMRNRAAGHRVQALFDSKFTVRGGYLLELMGLKRNWILCPNSEHASISSSDKAHVKKRDEIKAGLCSSTYKAVPESGSKFRSRRQFQYCVCECVCGSPQSLSCSHWATGWLVGPFLLPSCSCWACSPTAASVKRLRTRQRYHQARPLMARRRRTRRRTGD